MNVAVLTFPEAMTAALATGARIAREGWNGAGQHVRKVAGSRGRFVGESVAHDIEPFMALRNTRGEYIPWAPSQGDMMAVDWRVLP